MAGKDHNGWPSMFIYSKDQGGASNWGRVKYFYPDHSPYYPYDYRFADAFSISGDTLVVSNVVSHSGVRPLLKIYEKDHGGAGNWGLKQTIDLTDFVIPEGIYRVNKSSMDLFKDIVVEDDILVVRANSYQPIDLIYERVDGVWEFSDCYKHFGGVGTIGKIDIKNGRIAYLTPVRVSEVPSTEAQAVNIIKKVDGEWGIEKTVLQSEAFVEIDSISFYNDYLFQGVAPLSQSPSVYNVTITDLNAAYASSANVGDDSWIANANQQTFSPLDNDVFPNGGAQVVDLVDAYSALGNQDSLSIASGNVDVVFTKDTSKPSNRENIFLYMAKDSAGTTGFGKISINSVDKITPNDDLYFTPFMTPITFNPLENDTYAMDVGAEIYSLKNNYYSSCGTFSLDSSTSVTFTPNPSYSSQNSCYASVYYYFEDGSGNRPYNYYDRIQVYMSRMTPPTVSADPVGGIFYSPQQVTLTTNESTNRIFYTKGSSSDPRYGGTPYNNTPVIIDQSTVLKYVALNKHDRFGDVYSQKYIIDYGDINYPPTAMDASYTTSPNTSLRIQLQGHDMERASLRYDLLTSPSKGVISGSAPFLTYTPRSGYTGTDSFKFRVHDGRYYSDPATITVEIDNSKTPPSSGFTVTPTTGGQPLKVQFNNTSSGDVTDWYWNFGDGYSSTEQSPGHVYRNPGSYTVSLTSTGPGGSNTLTKEDVVTVTSEKVTSLTLSSEYAMADQPVSVELELSIAEGETVSSFSTDISYNSTLLENPQGVLWLAGRASSKTLTGQVVSPGIYRITVSGGNSPIKNGVVAKLTFDVSASAVDGESSTLSHSATGTNQQGAPVAMTPVSGSVTVVGSSSVLGDCNADNTVSISEVMGAVLMYLGIKSVSDCCDENGDLTVSMAECLQIFENFLNTGASSMSSTAVSSAMSGTLPTFSLINASGSAGDTLRIPLMLTNVSGTSVAGFSDEIWFDSDYFTYEGVETGSAASDVGKVVVVADQNTSSVKIGCISLSTTAIGDGEVAVLLLKVKDSIPSATTAAVHAPSATDASGNELLVSVADSTIYLSGIEGVIASASAGNAWTLLINALLLGLGAMSLLRRKR